MMFRVTCKDPATGKLFPLAIEGATPEEAMESVRSMGLFPKAAVEDPFAPQSWLGGGFYGAGGAGGAGGPGQAGGWPASESTGAPRRAAEREFDDHQLVELLAKSDLVRSIARSTIITNPVRTIVTGIVTSAIVLWCLSVLMNLVMLAFVAGFKH